MVKYRKATIEDVKQLVELRKKQLVDEGGYSDNNIDDELESYFFKGITDKALIIWLALQDTYIIGTAGVCFFQYPPSFTNTTGQVAYVTNVYTQNEFRKQGIASKLLEFVMEDIKNEGCKFARLHASSQGKKLYEKMGFVEAEGFMCKRML